jgi:ATP-dependent helicase Lhr and Lhr-like helicase
VYARRAGEPGNSDYAALDRSAIERVCDEARPDPRDADELHDALMSHGFLTHDEMRHVSSQLVRELIEARRMVCVATPTTIYVAVERWPEIEAVLPRLTAPPAGPGFSPGITVPLSRQRTWSRDEALVEIMRGRLSLVGPATARDLAGPLALESSVVTSALESLEMQGVVLRGRFRRDAIDTEWCERPLLARIHRYTLNRLRAEIEPVSPADYMRFLFDWQHAGTSARLSGPDGLREIIKTLDGFELPAAAWETTVLPARMDKYDPTWLDLLCLTGQVGWARLTRPDTPTRVARTTPIALFLREHADIWANAPAEIEPLVSADAVTVLSTLRQRGALFSHEIVAATGLRADAVRTACVELVSAGLIASDGFAGLRGLLLDRDITPREMSGRWAALAPREPGAAPEDATAWCAAGC